MNIIYVKVPISERLPDVNITDKPTRSDRVVLIDNCEVKHIVSRRLMNREDAQSLLNIGYTHWLEEVEITEETWNIIRNDNKSHNH